MALPSISRWERRVALVTGASMGIGAAIAKSLVKYNMIVIGCARNTDAIYEVALECANLKYPGELHAYKCDITKEDEVKRLFSWIDLTHGGADVCINNAGYSSAAPIIGSTVPKTREMLNTNVVALMQCSSLAIESMIRRNVNTAGHIFNINSFLGHFVKPLPASHAYGATKYAVTAITEGIRQELLEKKSRIRVTSISPARVNTSFNDAKVGFGTEVKDVVESAPPALQPQDVADTVVFALSTPETVQIHDILLRATGAQ